jgi:hypothetical protein
MRSAVPFFALTAMGAFLMGVGPLPNRPYTRDVSNDRYISDLSDANVNKRVYAAKVLRTRAEQAVKVYDRDTQGSLEYDEALGTLETLDDAVTPCILLLDDERVAPICADLLGLLEADRALGPLNSAIGAHPGRIARHAKKAIKEIEASSPGTSSPFVAPSVVPTPEPSTSPGPVPPAQPSEGGTP